MEKIIVQRFEEHLELVAAVQKDQALLAKLAAAAELIRMALITGHKLLFCGNGGSAAEHHAYVVTRYLGGSWNDDRRGEHNSVRSETCFRT